MQPHIFVNSREAVMPVGRLRIARSWPSIAGGNTHVARHLDLQTSRSLLHAILRACNTHNVDRVLIDTREATSKASVTDVWTLANELKSVGLSSRHRVAVVNRPKDDFDRAEFLEV